MICSPLSHLPTDLSPECYNSSPSSHEAVKAFSSGDVREDDLIMIGEIKCDGGELFATVIREELLGIVSDPMLSILELRKEDVDSAGVDTPTMLVASVKFKTNPKVRDIDIRENPSLCNTHT